MERDIDTKRMKVFNIEGDWTVVVGKTDTDNDYLSLKFKDPRDTWFHVDGCPGSHALLLYDPEREPRRPTLDIAAAIAAWFSKGRNASRIGVTVAPAGNIGKRRGAPAGQVTVSGGKTLKVKPALPEN
jgi:predicted ribosome quality control (RQC) complex YloA/Tae2 family protein